MSAQETKRAREASTYISAPTRILKKKKRVSTSLKPRSTDSLLQAWRRLETSITAALATLRAPSLASIKSALSVIPKNGEVAAVCVTMGAAALAGDRGTVFSSILETIPNHIRLASAHHSSVAAVMQAFQDTSLPLVVAVEDTELFSEAVIRDLVYYCGKRRASEEGTELARTGTPPIALLFGMGTSANALHTALGIEEATMVAHSVVEMPQAAECFEVIVDQVLANRQGVLFSRSLFELIEHEFFSRECTIAMILRTLRKVYTLHFYRQPLADIFCELADHSTVANYILDEEAVDAIKKALTPKALEEVSKNVCSVATRNANPSSNEDMRNECIGWHRQLQRWRIRCLFLETLFMSLLDACKVQQDEWRNGVTSSHSHLRLHIFKAFLVDENDSLAIAPTRFQSIIGTRIKKAGRPQLKDIGMIMKDALKSSILASEEEEMSLIGRIEEFEKQLDEAEKQAEQKTPEITKKTRPVRTAQGGAAARMRRTEALRQVYVQKDRKTVSTQGHRNILLKIFQDVVKLVAPLSEIPMHEVILFAETPNLQKYTGGMGGAAEPRSALFKAMRQPASILGSLEAEPDTAIAYRILAEGGRMVSLYDWYNSFAASVNAGRAKTDEEGNVSIDPIPAAEIQARFARGCSELEFLGVMKYTNRKTDHVMRLVFE